MLNQNLFSQSQSKRCFLINTASRVYHVDFRGIISNKGGVFLPGLVFAAANLTKNSEVSWVKSNLRSQEGLFLSYIFISQVRKRPSCCFSASSLDRIVNVRASIIFSCPGSLKLVALLEHLRFSHRIIVIFLSLSTPRHERNKRSLFAFLCLSVFFKWE